MIKLQILKNAGLTKTEVDIASKLLTGLKNAEIASISGCTEKTVKWHLTNVYKKTSTISRTDLFAWYMRHSATPEIRARKNSNKHQLLNRLTDKIVLLEMQYGRRFEHNYGHVTNKTKRTELLRILEKLETIEEGFNNGTRV